MSGADSIEMCEDIETSMEMQPTEKKPFLSRLNPHEILRREQRLSGYIWYASYGEEIFNIDDVKSLEERSLKV